MDLRVRTNSRTVKVAVSPEDSVARLKEKLSHFNPEYMNYAVVLEGKSLKDSMRVVDCGIRNETPLLLMKDYREIEILPITIRYYSHEFSFSVPAAITVEKLKKALAIKLGLYVEQMVLILNGSPLSDSADLRTELSSSSLLTVESVDHMEGKDGYRIYVKCLTGKMYNLIVTHDTLIETLKKAISERMLVFWDTIRLIYAGRCVYEPGTVEDFLIQREATIHVVLRLRC